MKYDVEPLLSAIERFIAKEDDELEERLSDEGYVNAALDVGYIEVVSQKIGDALSDRVKEMIEKLAGESDVEEFLLYVWPTLKDDDFNEILREFLEEDFRNMMTDMVQGWNISLDPELAEKYDGVITNFAENFIKDWSKQLAEIMHLSSNDKIEHVLLEAQKKALSIPEVEKMLDALGIREYGYKTRRVAVTEVLRLESYAQLEAMFQNPRVGEKEWVHTGSHKNKPRPNHQAISGQRVPVDATFSLIGADGASYSPMLPRDISLPASESINCHCIMHSIPIDSVTGMSLEEREELRRKAIDEVNERWRNRDDD